MVLSAGVVLYATLAVSSMRLKSATFDESTHLAAGYSYLALGDFRMNPEHPPLVKVLSAAPLLLLDAVIRTEDPTWTRGLQNKFGRLFLYRWNDADEMLFWGRVPIVALGCALCAIVFIHARRRWGDVGASLALMLCVLSPEVLAHGQLVTTDIGAALFIFVAVVAFDRLTEDATPARLILAGVTLGAALATKFSAVVLFPVLLCLGLATVLSRQPIPVRFGRVVSLTSPLARLAAVVIFLAVMGAIALIVVWAAYGFTSAFSLDPGIRPNWNLTPLDQPLRPAIELLRHTGLLPEAYLYGFLSFSDSVEGRGAFLLGRRSEQGWWYYFPVTFLLKTPIALMVLIVASVTLVFSRPRSWRDESFLWLPVLIYALIAMSFGLNIGHRHLLPIYPFLFVAAGRVGAHACLGRRRIVTGALVVMLAVSYAFSVLRVHPHYLAYFNELMGGPEQGYRHLVDSNLDWGQDLKGLKSYMDRERIPRIKLSYFGTADPAYHGIVCDRLPGYPPPERVVTQVSPGDLIAVSATNLQGVYLDEGRRLMSRLREREPVANIGYSILVFRSDFHWSLE
jgi:hypothetical protein